MCVVQNAIGGMQQMAGERGRYCSGRALQGEENGKSYRRRCLWAASHLHFEEIVRPVGCPRPGVLVCARHSLNVPAACERERLVRALFHGDMEAVCVHVPMYLEA